MTSTGNIGQYRIVRKIGAGGMGCVYLGEHILLGRRAAIKTLLPSLSVHREIVDRFFNEARATSAINDHGVVQIFDFGYHVDGTAYIVMELLEGESLQARLERLGRLPASQALRIARQVAASLAAAHERGIVHRDLKPENIFLIRDPEARDGERTKILDFGICKLAEDDTALTQSGTTMGTPIYMSPEQCRGAGGVDHRSDVYALGCVLFHILTGEPPFQGEGAGEYIVAHLQRPPPRASTIAPDLPSPVDELLERCLAKSPDHRFQSMVELQHAIERVLARISATGIDVAPPQSVLSIAPGYRSAYDVNLGTPVPTQDLSPRAKGSKPARSGRSGVSARWFVDPEEPLPSVDLVDDDDLEALRSRPRRVALALALVGALAALIATRFAIDSNASAEAWVVEGPDAGPDASSTVDGGPDAIVDAASPDAAAPDAATDAAVIGQPLPDAAPPGVGPPPPVVDPFPDDPVPVRSRAETPRERPPTRKRPTRTRPATRPESRAVETPRTAPVPATDRRPPTEDLYDSR